MTIQTADTLMEFGATHARELTVGVGPRGGASCDPLVATRQRDYHLQNPSWFIRKGGRTRVASEDEFHALLNAGAQEGLLSDRLSTEDKLALQV
jgi:hypothetical protein